MATPASFIERLTDLLKNYTDKLEQQDHPRLWEWIRRIAKRLNKRVRPKSVSLPSPTWLNEKEHQQTNDPKIRAQTLPPPTCSSAAAMWDEVTALRTYFLFAVAAILFGVLLLLGGQGFLGLLLVAGAGFGGHHFMQKWQQRRKSAFRSRNQSRSTRTTQNSRRRSLIALCSGSPSISRSPGA